MVVKNMADFQKNRQILTAIIVVSKVSESLLLRSSL